nr:MAG TPA: hypothetical protein [Crassvirales sp.]
MNLVCPAKCILFNLTAHPDLSVASILSEIVAVD